MRKATLLIAVLLCFGLATAFAGPVEVEPEYEAEASATWGVQLDDQVSGFANSAESSVMFTFIEEQTAEYGEGTTYGYIEVADFEVEFDAAGLEDSENANDAFSINVGEVTGKVFFGPAYLVVYDGADDAVDELDTSSLNDSNIISPTMTVGIDPNVSTDPDTEYGGVAVGFEVPDLVTVELGVASEADWRVEEGSVTWADLGYTQDELDEIGVGDDVDDEVTATDTPYNEHNAYVWSVNAELTPVEAASVNLVSNMWYGVDGNAAGEAGNPASVGLSADYTMPLNDDMDFIPSFGFDMMTVEDENEDQEMQMEFGGALALSWASLGLDEDDDDHIDFLPGDEEVTSGVSLSGVYGIHPVDLIADPVNTATTPPAGGAGLDTDGKVDEDLNTLAMKLAFYEDGGDDGFLPIIGGAAMVNYNMVMENEDAEVPEAKSDLGLGLELNADLGVVAPYAGMIYEIFDVAGNYGYDADANADSYLGLYQYDNDEDHEMNNKSNFQVNVGTDINVIPDTTFTIDYASGNLMAEEKAMGGNASSVDDTYYVPMSDWGGSSMAGALTLETSIEF